MTRVGKRPYRVAAGLAAAVTVTSVLTSIAAASAGGAARAGSSPVRSPEQRAATLVSLMTLDEKIAEVHGGGLPAAR